MRNPLGILAFLCSTLQDTMKGEVFHGFLPASFITGLIFRVLPKCGANPCGWSWDGAPEGGAELESPGPWAGLCLAWTPVNGSSLAGIPGVPGVPVPSRDTAGVSAGIPLLCRPQGGIPWVRDCGAADLDFCAVVPSQEIFLSPFIYGPCLPH